MTPTAADRGEIVLVDTSVAVPLVTEDHQFHERASGAVHGRRVGLAGHAAFETFSVLSRLPPPHRRTPDVVSEILRRGFPETRFLPEAEAGRLLERLGGAGISGGSVYDALVGAAAVAHDLPLATLDRRALDTYRELEVRVHHVG